MEWLAGHPPFAAVPEAADAPGWVTLTLCLPLERLSVPVVRHLIRATLLEAGVRADDVVSLELAVSEACSNAVQHAGRGDHYQVNVVLGPGGCAVRVSDDGVGFEAAKGIPEVVDLTTDAEQGRGLAIMRALVDHVQVESRPSGGTVVCLDKHLDFDEAAPARRLIVSAAHESVQGRTR